MTRINTNRIGEFLLLATTVELLLCGSGQIIHIIGSLTARMTFFLLIFICCILYINRINAYLNKIDIYILTFYTIVFSASISIALISNSKASYIFEDIKPLSYFFILPFFLSFITNQNTVNKIKFAIKYVSLSMAIIYLIYIALIKFLGLIDFSIFYQSMEEESDFMFRGEQGEMFYKGFVFLPIGLIFWFAEKKWVPCILLITAIYYTMTRGFYVMSFLGLSFYLFSQIKDARIKITLILLLTILGLLLISSGLFEMGEDRAHGDEMRIVTFYQVRDKVTLLSFFIGHGFGEGVDFRPIHMENSFLEIFNKQGLLGIAFWISFLSTIIFYTIKSEKKQTPIIFCIGATIVYIQSLFNPYITNPIGIGYLLIAYSVCKFYYIKTQISHGTKSDTNMLSNI